MKYLEMRVETVKFKRLEHVLKSKRMCVITIILEFFSIKRVFLVKEWGLDSKRWFFSNGMGVRVKELEVRVETMKF